MHEYEALARFARSRLYLSVIFSNMKFSAIFLGSKTNKIVFILPNWGGPPKNTLELGGGGVALPRTPHS